MSALSAKRQAFVAEYLIDLSAAAAARRAGYSEKTAKSQGQRLLTNVDVQDAIMAGRIRLQRVSEVTVDRIVDEYRKLAFANTTDAVQVKGGWVTITDTDDLSPDQQAAIAEIHQTKDGVRIKFHDKKGALDSLGKHLGMFKDDVTITHDGPPPTINVRFGKPAAETPDETQQE